MRKRVGSVVPVRGAVETGAMPILSWLLEGLISDVTLKGEGPSKH